MPRRALTRPSGVVFHVLNRSVRRVSIFRHTSDYDAFEILLAQCVATTPMRLIAYCLMPNHWHLVTWPIHGGHLSTFMHRLAMTHAKRWHVAHGTTGTGPLYQGRYRAMPVRTAGHFYNVLRYVESNSVRAQLVRRAEDWPWSSASSDRRSRLVLCPWPYPRPADWLEQVNRLADR